MAVKLPALVEEIVLDNGAGPSVLAKSFCYYLRDPRAFSNELEELMMTIGILCIAYRLVTTVIYTTDPPSLPHMILDACQRQLCHETFESDELDSVLKESMDVLLCVYSLI